jgi:TonB-dependent receptor
MRLAQLLDNQKNLRLLFIFILINFSAATIFGQTGQIAGKVIDDQTGEELIGASVIIQGTGIGTVTDLDGNFLLANVQEGSYNIVVSYLAYDDQIVKAEVTDGGTYRVDLKLQPITIGLGSVTVVGRQKTSTEISLINSIKETNLIVSGISAQQIARTQDSDAAEVVRRIPGITITDGRFMIVRGLVERYNSVLINSATAPSFESDKRAFSFDAMPSGMIDNILIYKSPSPELPADFAGAAVNIITKNDAYENSFKISYSAGYAQNASFSKNYHTYQGGRLDWLGLDDGTRKIPAGIPNTNEFNDLYVWPDRATYLAKTEEITRLSRSFNNIWEYQTKSPFLDQNASAVFQHRFRIGKASLGNITALNYKIENRQYNILRREYYLYDAENDTALMNFNFNDERSIQEVNVGLIHNWNFIYGNNQKIMFNNFLNNMGENTTSLREGVDYYDGETIKATNLRYKNRFIYSGQLSGKQILNNQRTKIDWLLGYSYTNSYKPDDRRLYFVRDPNNNYYLELQNQATNVKNGGRLSIDLDEHVYNARADIVHEFKPFMAGPNWSIRGGLLYEYKNRDYDSRLIGVVTPRPQVAVNLYQPVEEIFKEDNFFFDQVNIQRAGLAYSDATKTKDSYTAENTLLAGYLSLGISLFKNLTINGGTRVEKFDRLLTDFYIPQAGNDSLDITRDSLNFFPSVNITYKITEKHLIRFSYGKTVNRPEFREISATDYEDFDMNVIIHGNRDLMDAYCHNYDLRYEWYPNAGEIISIAGFYKKFINPIELFLIPAGTGYDYAPYNTEEAYSAGIELDIRKTFTEFENSTGFLRHLKDLTFIFNSSIIRSAINTNKSFAREESRIMQGQSPYIINLALFYNNVNKNFSVNLVYNNIGKRIAYAGTPANPHTWELSRNSLDLTITKNIGKRIELRMGFKDIINEPVRFVQYWGAEEQVEVDTYKWIPNRKITLGLAVNLNR